VRPFLLLLLLILSASTIGAEEIPVGPVWKAKARAGVEAWDADRKEEAEKTLTDAVAEAGRARSLPVDGELALAHQILSFIAETSGQQRGAEEHFRKASDLLAKAWTAGAKEAVLDPFRKRAQERSERFRYPEALSLRRLILAVTDARSPRTRSLVRACGECAYVLSDLGRFQESEVLFRRALAVSETIRDSKGEAKELNNLAACLHRMGRYREAGELYRRALQQIDKPGVTPFMLGLCLKNVGNNAASLGDETGAEALFRRAEALLEKASPDSREELIGLAHFLKSWGDLRRSQGMFEEAQGFYDRFWKVIPMVEANLSLSLLRQIQGRHEEAEALALNSVQVFESLLSADSYRLAHARTRLAQIQFAAGKQESAEALFRQALKAQEVSPGPLHPNTAETADALGILLCTQTRYAEAEPLFQAALEARLQAFGGDHALVSETLGHQADLFVAMGRSDDAETPYRKALDLDESRLGPDHPGVALRCRQLGTCLMALGQSQEAEPLLQRALKIDETSLGADHPALIEDLKSLRALYRTLGDSKKVEEMETRLKSVQEKTRETFRQRVAPGPEAQRPSEPAADTAAPVPYHQQALRRGMGFLEEARRAQGTDFDTKRRAYADAEVAFLQALKFLEGMKASGKAPADVEEQATELRVHLSECRKFRPIEKGK